MSRVINRRHHVAHFRYYQASLSDAADWSQLIRERARRRDKRRDAKAGARRMLHFRAGRRVARAQERHTVLGALVAPRKKMMLTQRAPAPGRRSRQ